MAPKKETATQKASRLIKKSTEFTHKLDVVRVIASLKHFPAAVASVKKHLDCNGWLLTPEQMDEVKKKGESNPDDASESLVSALKKTEYIPLDQRPELQVEVHRNFKTWSKMPPAHVTTLLGVVQPMAFASPMLKALRKKGQREVSSSVLLEYLEMECGVDPGSDIGHRRFLYEIAEDLLKRSASMGKPCTSMKLPAMWDAGDGVYELNEDQGVVMLTLGTDTVPVDPKDLNNAPFSDLRVETNYSMQRASIRSISDPSLRSPCVLLHVKGLAMQARSSCGRGGQPKALAAPCSSSTGGTAEASMGSPAVKKATGSDIPALLDKGSAEASKNSPVIGGPGKADDGGDQYLGAHAIGKETGGNLEDPEVDGCLGEGEGEEEGEPDRVPDDIVDPVVEPASSKTPPAKRSANDVEAHFKPPPPKSKRSS